MRRGAGLRVQLSLPSTHSKIQRRIGPGVRASKEEQAIKKKKNLNMENAKQENETKDEKEQDANKESLGPPFESW